MYAVVYKDRVIVGPMNWNRAIFQGALERQKIATQLPRVAPEQLPHIVNPDAKIMMVEEVRPTMNPRVEYYYGPTWTITDSKAIANYDVVDSPIEAARMNFKTQAADERYRKEIKGVTVDVQGASVTVDTARDARNIFIQKYSLMADGDVVNWKFPEAWLTLTKAELGSVIAAGAAHIQSCFDWEKSISDQIDAATTKAELIAIEIVEPQGEQDPGMRKQDEAE
jgi:hypothetical protein